ncbi:tyrosine-type recombinase/integrase [Sphingorhabdus sp.]|jgi:integrase|uniref:tyrosine-type recombinase/integrase n=2 Tax=Sphingorhabdus sp. TaxID=1902408 RepID=UPI004053A954
MPTMRITKAAVDAIQPTEKDQLYWDNRLPGFGCKVTPKGSKIFIYQYRLGGRGSPARRFTIGKHGALTADQAKREAEMLALKVAQGSDPQRVKAETARATVDLAFKSYVDKFAAECLLAEWPATHRYVHALLLKYAVPVLGNKPLNDITRKDINAVLAPVKTKAATAANLFGVIRRLLRWAVEQEDLERSPIEGVKGPKPPPSRDRVLDDAELQLVWKASDALGYPFGPLIRLLILTGARREEIAALEWAEIDRETCVWVLPPSRSKNGVAARQPLSSLAVAELDILAERHGTANSWPKSGLVFSTTGNTSVSGYSRAKNRLDKAIDALTEKQDAVPLAPWRVHDLRRTLATGLQRLGVRFEVTEAVLNHVSGSKSGVAGIYQRHDWAQEKAAALDAWAAHVAALLTDADKTNVIQLSKGKKA